MTNLQTPESQDVLMIGASGDLARRKLLPALYNLWRSDLLPLEGRIIGMARTPLDTMKLREMAHTAVKQFSRTGVDEDTWEQFAKRLSFARLEDGAFQKLEAKHPNRIIYLAVPPTAVESVVEALNEAGMVEGTRLIVEKPFGEDLASARELNDKLKRYFKEGQIFRIDHYLGKETVQNILVFRFGNAIFERIWNRDAISHIEITVAESIGMEGRGGFYEGVGALRDILQNHVLQMLALMTMEPPPSFDAEAIRDEKAKLLRAVRPMRPEETVFGQYTEGRVTNELVPAYQDEPGVNKGSTTDTFVACRLYIDNWRWAGVPMILRTGKRLPYRATEIEVEFKSVPLRYFPLEGGEPEPNHLSLSIQPEEQIGIEFLAKEPGPVMAVKNVEMDFNYDEAFKIEPAEAYERLIHDVMVGDHTLFVREDAVDLAWEIVAPVLETPPDICPYPAGTWGPPEADELIAPSHWHLR